MSALDEALWAVSRGWFVFPVKANEKKPPLLKDWENNASNDQQTVIHWAQKYPGCNWGLACGPSGLTVIDSDVKGDGAKSLTELEIDHGFLPNTMFAKTPSDGGHYYFLGLTATTSRKLGPGIDTRSKGGYVLLPGSKTQKGVYKWANQFSLAPLPEEWAALLSNPVEKDPRRDVPAVDLDQPHVVARAAEFLVSAAEIAIDGINDGCLYRVACQVRDLGISEDTCFDLMLRLWNPRCKPPWEGSEIESHFAVRVANAYRYARGQAGASDPAADFDAIPDEPVDVIRPFFDHELQGDPPARKWIVDQWIPQGEVSSLYGDGGQGKTMLAGQLGFAVAYGLPFLGMKAKQMSVFAALAEDDRNEVHRRVHALRRYHGFDSTLPEGYFRVFAFPSENYTLVRFDSKGKLVPGPFYQRLVSYLEEMPAGPKLLILDTLADIFDGNENVRGQANAFIKNVLRGLCVKFELTVVLLAHPSRSGMAQEDNLSGSTAWNNAVRNRLTLTSHKTLPDVRVFTRIKSNYARSGDYITLRWNDGVFVAANEDDMFKAVANEHEEKILALLADAVSQGMPYGFHNNHSRCVFKNLEHFKNGDGKAMEKVLLKAILDNLMSRGLIEEVKGRPRGNGIYPADMVEN